MNLLASEYKLLNYFIKSGKTTTFGSLKKKYLSNKYVITLHTLQEKSLVNINRKREAICDTDTISVTDAGEVAWKEYKEIKHEEKKQYFLNHWIAFLALVVSILSLIKSCWVEIIYIIKSIANMIA